MLSETLILKAVVFAEAAHRGHKRKYTGDPYLVHLLEVAGYLAAAGMPSHVIAAGVLHDTVEDTATQPINIYRALGDKRISDLVIEVTEVYSKEAYPEYNRAKRKALEQARLAGVSYFAQTIKYADILSNTRDVAEHDPKFAYTYLAEVAGILSVMTKGDAHLYRLAKAACVKARDELEEMAQEIAIKHEVDRVVMKF